MVSLSFYLPAKARTARCARKQDRGGGAGAPWVRGRAVAGPSGRDSSAVRSLSRIARVSRALSQPVVVRGATWSRWRRLGEPEPVVRSRAQRARAISPQPRSRTTGRRASFKEVNGPASLRDGVASTAVQSRSVHPADSTKLPPWYLVVRSCDYDRFHSEHGVLSRQSRWSVDL